MMNKSLTIVGNCLVRLSYTMAREKTLIHYQEDIFIT